MFQLAKFKSTPLDSCDRNLVNTKSTETIGDYLCAQVKRWLKKDKDFQENGKNNIKIPYYFSQCGKDWEPVTGDGAALYSDEELCCTPNGTFRRCDGSDFVNECPEKI